MKENHQLINADSGCVEWYTPTEIIEAARKCLGGNIKLDPFSCEQANKTVRANFYMTKEQDGWSSDWFGTVFCNHPFSRENNNRIAAKVIQEYNAGSQIVMITFAATSEKWFRPLLDYPQCYLHGRTNYYDQNGNKVKGVTKGSVITYLGDHLDAFYEAFKDLGTIKIPYTP